MLAHGVSADGHAALADDYVPEELCRAVPVGQSLQVGDALVADDFRNLRVGVLAREVILTAQQRLQHLLVAELVGQTQVFLVAGDSKDIGKGLVQSTLLTAKHLLNLLVAQPAHLANHPVGQSDEHLFGIFAACHQPCIAQSGVDFVNVVERNPPIVQSERSRADVAVGYLAPYFLRVRHAAQVAVPGRILTAFQLLQEIVHALFHLTVARSGKHVGKSREIMAADVAVKTGVLPVGIVLGLGRQPSSLQVGSKQTVGIEPHQIVNVRLLIT